jgi:histidinol dehydrogenase
MRKYFYNQLGENELSRLTKRSQISFETTYETVKPILKEVKTNGLKAALEYAEKLDGFKGGDIKVSEEEFQNVERDVSDEFKNAVKTASANIEKFHKAQIPQRLEVETMLGVQCFREARPIENVGLYIPGGTAILPSTLLMLGIPAKLAGCKRVVAMSPAKEGEIAPEILWTAKYIGVDEFYKIGGAHAVALFAYGDSSIKKVDKIFGPGNQYVTAAKNLVSIDPDGASIDMPAGPSEVLVIADKNAEAAYVASDLLSQAEHGLDSQSILVTDNEELADKVLNELANQTDKLDRKEFLNQSLENSYILITNTVQEAFNFSNRYAPEHLILQIDNHNNYLHYVENAGSVFLGNYSPESVGDYASGTNHSLPTYGYAKTFSGVGVDSFIKYITFQELSRGGLQNLSKAVITLANAEGLDAHANAVKQRLKDG